MSRRATFARSVARKNSTHTNFDASWTLDSVILESARGPYTRLKPWKARGVSVGATFKHTTAIELGAIGSIETGYAARSSEYS
jgi:hypothetical protein